MDLDYVAEEEVKKSRTPNFEHFNRRLTRYLMLILSISIVNVLNNSTIYIFQATAFQKFNETNSTLIAEEYLRPVMNLAFITTFELVSGNGTTYVTNYPSFPLEGITLQVMKASQEKFSLSFTSTNHYSQSFSNILFKDACAYLTDELKSSCYSVVDNSRDVGLIGLILTMQDRLTSIYTSYTVSNKTKTTIGAALTTIVTSIFPLQEVINVVLVKLKTILIEEIEENQQTFSKSVSITIFITSVSQTIIIVLIWKVFLKEWNESRNNLKRFLKLVPKRIILNNKIFRTYLIQNSDDIFYVWKFHV